MLKISILDISLKMTNLIIEPPLPGANNHLAFMGGSYVNKSIEEILVT